MSRGPYPILLMLAMSLPGAVRALGLGDIRIESALNEPLSAQIDIVGATRDELAALTASVANREIFQKYGADRPSFLSSATFKVGLDGQGRPVLNVRSAEAFNDPLVSFIVDLRWGKNQVVREYSLLLDPPGYGAPHSAPEVQLAASPASPGYPAQTLPTAIAPPLSPRATRPSRSASLARTAPPRQPAAVQAAAPTESARAPGVEPDTGYGPHRVRSGETLRAVARQAGARNELHAQRMMIAIFRANPNAFDGNINRLHRDALLSIPTDADLEGISGADAKREVRAHMTAWRLDGRPTPAHRVLVAQSAPAHVAATVTPAPTLVVAPALAANAAPVAVVAPPAAAATLTSPPDAEADTALKARVASLELSLSDMHQQLATENAKLQSLKDVVAPPEAPPAELVHMPIISSAHADSVSHAAAGSPQTADKGAWLAPVVLSAGLLVAGFAYFRRRRAAAPDAPVQPALVPVEPVAPQAAVVEKAAVPQAAAPVRAFTSPAPVVVTRRATDPVDPSIAAAVLDLPARLAETAKNAVVTTEPQVNTDKTTVSLEIDIEALERSYLDSLPVESTAIDTVAIDTSDLDTALIQSDLHTAIIDARNLPKAVPNTALDYNLVDLDAETNAEAQHVHMPSGLYDHPVVAERRTNIVDVLKAAIDKDPQRSDLRMKLLETYYSAAATNQRAFIDVVRKLSREPDHLSPEEWEKVNMMGRQIAADDILFAGASKDDDLADCA